MALSELLLVRHGESEANRVAAEAEQSGALRIPLPARDADVELSALGRDQATAVGRALAGLGRGDRPTAAWVSPYRRARETAELAVDEWGRDIPQRVDERLRDRELGILDGLTWAGVQEFHPEEAERRRFLGKFYHRPPGGESWADLALRVRSVLRDIEDGGDDRVLVVCHDAVVMVFRYVLERLDERTLLHEAATNPVPNASITRLVRGRAGDPWRAQPLNDVRHLEQDEQAEVTLHAGDARGTKP
jgi:broad specificity phosphatase PhoE